MTAETIPIWLDCDPGNDDTFGILLAAFHPRFRLLGISTVHGNASLAQTTHNTLALLDVLAFKQDDIKVYAGESRPLKGEPKHALEIHGEFGVGGVTLPSHPKIKVSTDMLYLEAMRTAILNYPGEICVVCTGTMTNLAKLLREYPDMKEKIRLVAIMGGALDTGNVTPYAEFNFHCDPYAADIVVNDKTIGPKCVLAPLNLTHQAMATKDVRTKMYNPEDENANSPIREMFYNIVMFYHLTYIKNHGDIPGPPLHDPVAIFSLLPLLEKQQGKNIDKYKYQYLRRKLTIVQEGVRIGETVVTNNDFDSLKEEEDGCYVGMVINVDMFWDYILDSLVLAENQIYKVA